MRATIWRDLRWRLPAAAALAALPIGIMLLGMLSEGGRPVARDPLGYLDRVWFRLPGGGAIWLLVALVVAASGSLVRPSRDVAYWMALPVSRGRWLLSHVAAAVLTLAALMTTGLVVLCAFMTARGIPVPFGALVVRTLLELAAAAMWVGPMTALMVLVRRPIIGVTLAFGALMASPVSRFALNVPPKPSGERLPALDPWAFADPRAWSDAVPLGSIAVALVIGVGGTMAALWLFRRLDL